MFRKIIDSCKLENIKFTVRLCAPSDADVFVNEILKQKISEKPVEKDYIESLKKLVQLHPRGIVNLYNLSYRLYLKGELGEAEKYLTQLNAAWAINREMFSEDEYRSLKEAELFEDPEADVLRPVKTYEESKAVLKELQHYAEIMNTFEVNEKTPDEFIFAVRIFLLRVRQQLGKFGDREERIYKTLPSFIFPFAEESTYSSFRYLGSRPYFKNEAINSMKVYPYFGFMNFMRDYYQQIWKKDFQYVKNIVALAEVYLNKRSGNRQDYTHQLHLAEYALAQIPAEQMTEELRQLHDKLVEECGMIPRLRETG